MRAIEDGDVPPELRPSSGGPVVAGVPIENVSLPQMGEENTDTDEAPDTFDSL